MTEQPDLFAAIDPLVSIGKHESIQAAFEEFHRINPHVYRHLVRAARRARFLGRRKIGIGMLFEVMRWNYFVQTEGDEFKLNNNFTSRYARLIEEENPDLKGIFETRCLKSD